MPKTRWRLIGVCIFLAAITWLVFGQTRGHSFINLDDPEYVLKNPEISKGITLHGIAWAFSHSHTRNWHPLTTVTHMLDCQIYGQKAAGHHLTNVLLHIIAVLLLFLVLQEMTGALWRSAFVAAIFAIHPLRAESVAWVAERKDVLSGVFFMLTLAAYLRYVRKASLPRYLLVAFVFALGLMSKPMLVTLPFVLLLLDYWPLNRGQKSEVGSQRSEVKTGRFETQNFTKLILEKIPLFILSAIACGIALLVQKQAMSSIAIVPLWARVYNALVSCVAYIWQMFWPAKLAFFYPYPSGIVAGWVGLVAAAILLGVTYGAWKVRTDHPYVLVGWLWYLIMLVPVIGLVQVGLQARADRYTYLPHIGLYLLTTWMVADLTALWRGRREILTVGASAAIIALTWRARIQTSYWKNSESIWTRTLAVTSNNAFAHQNLGYFLLDNSKLDDAILHLQEALKIWPDYVGDRSNPDNARVHTSLGTALIRKGLVAEAITHYEKSLALAPRSTVTLNNLALILSTSLDARFRNGSRAIQLAERADKLSGGENPSIVRTLAAAYAESGRFNDAIDTAERALKLAAAKRDSVLISEVNMDIDLYELNLPRRDARR